MFLKIQYKASNNLFFGVYAINAYYDFEDYKVNKPNRPLSSGKMTKKHAFKYVYLFYGSYNLDNPYGGTFCYRCN
jgi:hypothetical protein